MAAALGAWWGTGAPLLLIAAVVVLAVWRRHVTLVALAVVLVVGARSELAVDALSPPSPGSFDAWVTLVDDPRPAGPVGVTVTIRHEDRRMVASAHGPVAGRLDDALAGERVHIVGTVRPLRRAASYDRWRHVVGRITVERVEGHQAGPPVTRLANAIRRTLVGGAESLDRADRAVFLGMVIGDDRDQTPVVADDFRAAGLGHLLVVSGQNVAFVLAVAAPVVGRWRPAARAVGLLLILGVFALLTRFEPSVLRAVAMAGVAVGAGAFGRPVECRRALSCAVAGLLVIDPFLVHLVAFQLSVAATAGIVWWSAAVADRLPGPAWFRVPFATTTAAQLAVSPLLLAIFGPVPLASLPANLLAGPVSGAVMVWGFTGGLAAGLIGGPVAEVIHVPTGVMLWWIGGVASAAARGPQATLGAPAVAVAAIAVAGLLVGGRAGRPAALLVGLVVAVIAIRGAPQPPAGPSLVADGITLWTADGVSVVILDDPPSPRAVLEQLRVVGAGLPSLIVALDGDRADADAVVALHDRFGPVAVAAPPLHRVPGGRTVGFGEMVDLGPLTVRIDAVEPRLALTVIRASPAPSGDAGRR